MGNLLRLIVDLAEDGSRRAEFRADPDGALLGFSDICGEDVAAAIDVARVQVAPDVADRLTDTLATRGRGESPRDVAIRSLLALCDSVDAVDGHRPVAGVDPADGSQAGGGAIPASPPGAERPVHLWPVASSDERDAAGTDPGGRATLAPVPDPPGGFEFAVLELVRLPDGIPDADIEPGAEATIVAVHREPELSYEVEISDTDGSRRFLGIVPTDAVERPL